MVGVKGFELSSLTFSKPRVIKSQVVKYIRETSNKKTVENLLLY